MEVEGKGYGEKKRKKTLCAARLGDLTFFFVLRRTFVFHVAAAVFSRNNGRTRARVRNVYGQEGAFSERVIYRLRAGENDQ